MKHLLFVFSIFLFGLFFGVSPNFAQPKSQFEQVILVEVTFEENPEIKREIEIPIDFKFGFGGKSYCDHCDDKFGEYEFNAGVSQAKKDRFLVRFAYIYPRKWKGCNFEKVFIVQKDKPREMRVKCGVKLKAYYAIQKKIE
jgi:hypothetical protein